MMLFVSNLLIIHPKVKVDDFVSFFHNQFVLPKRPISALPLVDGELHLLNSFSTAYFKVSLNQGNPNCAPWEGSNPSAKKY